MFFGYWSFIRYIFCKYLLPVYDLSSHSCESVLPDAQKGWWGQIPSVSSVRNVCPHSQGSGLTYGATPRRWETDWIGGMCGSMSAFIVPAPSIHLSTWYIRCAYYVPCQIPGIRKKMTKNSSQLAFKNHTSWSGKWKKKQVISVQNEKCPLGTAGVGKTTGGEENQGEGLTYSVVFRGPQGSTREHPSPYGWAFCRRARGIPSPEGRDQASPYRTLTVTATASSLSLLRGPQTGTAAKPWAPVGEAALEMGKGALTPQGGNRQLVSVQHLWLHSQSA